MIGREIRRLQEALTQGNDGERDGVCSTILVP